MFLLNMLIVGLVETGPDTFLLQLQAETGEIVEYTVSKNDKNLWALYFNKNYKLIPHWGYNKYKLIRIAVNYNQVARYAR